MIASTRRPAIVASLLIVLSNPIALAGTTIVDPAQFPAGTDVSNLYSGVTLSTAKGSMVIFDLDVVEPLQLISDQADPVYSTGTSFSPMPGGGLWSAGQSGGDDVLRVDFHVPVNSVTIEFYPDDTDTGVLQIYSADDALLDEVLKRSSSAFTLGLGSPVPIAYMLTTGGDSLGLGRLSYDDDTNGGGENLILNGDFESGNTGFSSDFTFVGLDRPEEASYTIVTDPSTVHSQAASYLDHTLGDGTGLMMVANGGLDTDDVVWSQSVPVQPGTMHVFSLWYSAWFPEPPAGLQVRINGMALGPVFTAPTTTGLWVEYSVPWDSGSNDHANIEIMNTSTASTGNDFSLDDISLSPIPDADTDGVPDTMDNCLVISNPDQRDTDFDDIGNRCDADFDQNCIVNFIDLRIMKAFFFLPGDFDTDLDGDGMTNFFDLKIMKQSFFATPGPSGLPNPCSF